MHLLGILLPIYCSICRLMNWSNNSLNLDKFFCLPLKEQRPPAVKSFLSNPAQRHLTYSRKSTCYDVLITHFNDYTRQYVCVCVCVCVCFRPWWRPCPVEETCWWTSVRHTTEGSLPSSRSVWGRWVSGWRWTGTPSTTRRRGGRRTTLSLPTSGGFSFGLRTFGLQWPKCLNQLVDYVFDI